MMRSAVTLSLVILGPVLVIATFLFFGAFDRPGDPQLLRMVVLADLIYVLIVAALVSRQVVRIIAARRRRSAGSKLHLRLTGVFTMTALIPTVLVAIFAAVTLNFGLESWFSDRVRQVVNNSLTAAQAYEREHRDTLEADAKVLQRYLDAQKRRVPLLGDSELRQYLNRGQLQMQRTLSEAFVIDTAGDIVVRGERSYLFDFEKPSPADIRRALAGNVVIIQDWGNNEFRALVPLEAYPDRLLYVTRPVDGNILSLLDDTKETVALYNQLESERGKLLFEFALIYLGFALIVILAAVWFGMWFAERLSRPVGRLAGAAERVGRGDLDVRVIEEKGDDEIAILGRTFNNMIAQVRGQRNALLEVHAETEKRRRLFDSVLSGVTAGVIGLDAAGNVEFLNAAAAKLLGLDAETDLGRALADTVPEFAPLLERLGRRGRTVEQGEIALVRGGKQENLLVRIAARRTQEGRVEGYVIAFDDVTDLVSAQRMAAWGDVARRIAHEIKNPLTPIQLSADRLRRKFGPMVGEERETLEQYADVIIRQTGDLRRIVDEFAKFARMPAPEKRAVDLRDILRDTVLLQNEADPDITVTLQAPEEPVMASLDPALMGQAFTNLIKNAREAVAEKRKTSDTKGEVRVLVEPDGRNVVIRIQDNGIGLPANRARLFEPYVTHRDSGTGLGLSIVKKIIEEHEGYLELRDAPSFGDGETGGAEAVVTLPLIQNNEQEQGTPAGDGE